jgi:ribosomal protein S18 acetylase RimI-like enzyme
MTPPRRRLQSPVIIRDALPGELPGVGDLRVEAYRADGVLPSNSPYAEVLRRLGADGDGEILVAVEGPLILGTIMIQLWPHGGELLRGPEEAEIRALAVAPGERGRGAGRALLAAITKRAAERGIHHLVLLTLPAMVAAQHLYGQAGFVRLPERDWSPEPGTRLMAFGRQLSGA